MPKHKNMIGTKNLFVFGDFSFFLFLFYAIIFIKNAHHPFSKTFFLKKNILHHLDELKRDIKWESLTQFLF